MEKTVLISIPIDDLQTIIIDCVNSCLKNSKYIQASPAEDEFLTAPEAADFLNLTERTILKKARNGDIRSSKRAGKLYFSKKDLTNWLKEGIRKSHAEILAEAQRHIQEVSRKKRSHGRSKV